jgi:hypothetical protein
MNMKTGCPLGWARVRPPPEKAVSAMNGAIDDSASLLQGYFPIVAAAARNRTSPAMPPHGHRPRCSVRAGTTRACTVSPHPSLVAPSLACLLRALPLRPPSDRISAVGASGASRGREAASVVRIASPGSVVDGSAHGDAATAPSLNLGADISSQSRGREAIKIHRTSTCASCHGRRRRGRRRRRRRRWPRWRGRWGRWEQRRRRRRRRRWRGRWGR